MGRFETGSRDRLMEKDVARTDCRLYGDRAGIYIHIPLCKRKCPYCDFFSITDLTQKPALLWALKQEIRLSANPDLTVDSLYIGGGTPSLLTPGEVGEIINACGQAFHIEPSAEITMEVNPGTVSTRTLGQYRQVGVNRLSIGVQSFQDKNLEFLGRIHSSKAAQAAIASARQAGFDNIGLDLMYGLPGQGKAGLLLDLKAAVSFSPEHLSCYFLTYAPHTPLYNQMKGGGFVPLSDDRMGDLFETTASFLRNHGYVHYEVSNFARSAQYTSVHNQKYWSHASYLGLGPAAHSFDQNRRWWNHADVQKYMADIKARRLPVAGEETLTRTQLMMETISLALRTRAGIDLADFKKRFQKNFVSRYAQTLGELKQEGFLRLDAECCRPTPKGMRMADGIARRLVC